MKAHLRLNHGVPGHSEQFFSSVPKEEMTHCRRCPAIMSPLGLANHIKHKHPELPHPSLRDTMHVTDFLAERMAQHVPPPPQHNFNELECAESLVALMAV